MEWQGMDSERKEEKMRSKTRELHEQPVHRNCKSGTITADSHYAKLDYL